MKVLSASIRTLVLIRDINREETVVASNEEEFAEGTIAFLLLKRSILHSSPK